MWFRPLKPAWNLVSHHALNNMDSNHCKSGSKWPQRGTSMVIQWLRIHLAMQGTRVQSLVGELGFHMPRSNSPHATTLEPTWQWRSEYLNWDVKQSNELTKKNFFNYLRGVTSIKLQRIQGVHIILERTHTVYNNIINNILKGHQILKDSINLL